MMKFKILLMFCIWLSITTCKTYQYDGQEYATAEMRDAAITKDQQIKKEKEAEKQEELRIEIEKKNQEIQMRQKALKKTGLDFNAFDLSLTSWLLLRKEAEEFDKTGQTIKAKRKWNEVEEARKKIEKIFRIGQSISATAECPFERISGEISYEETRQFRLSCYEKKILDSSIIAGTSIGEKKEVFAYLDLIFEFVALSDKSYFVSINDWEASAQTNNGIAEIFEAGSRFTGSAKIVGGWRSPVSGSAMKITGIMDPFINKNAIIIKVKIVSLQPLN